MSDLEADQLAQRSRALLDASVDNLDAHTRSRLTQARHAALAVAEQRRGSWLPSSWLPAGALAAAAVVAVALWMGQPGIPSAPRAVPATTMAATAVEDVEIYATNDAIELFAEDPEFYEWAGASTGPDDIG
jgi:hypothetical protein